MCSQDASSSAQVLKAHVLPGIVDQNMAEQRATVAAPDPAAFTTLHGTDILAAFVPYGFGMTITPAGTDIEANPLATDIPVCSGILHVVDKVLLPADLAEGGDGGPEGGNAWEALEVSEVLITV